MSADDAPARVWQMTRIGAGDYLLLSNDLSTLWREPPTQGETP